MAEYNLIVSESLHEDYSKKLNNALQAERTVHRVTFNPNSAKPGETLRIPVPKLSRGVVIVPDSFALTFDLNVTGQVNNYLVQNVCSALVERFTVTFGGQILIDFNGYDLFKLYRDLFLTEKERELKIMQGIYKDKNVSKLRQGSGDKVTSGKDDEVRIAYIYEKRYKLPIDFEVLNDHGAFYPYCFNDELIFEIKLNSKGNVVLGSDPNDLDYNLKNIELEYEVLDDLSFANRVERSYMGMKGFLYEHVTLYKTTTFAADTTTIINETVDIPRHSLKGLLLLFYQKYTAGTRKTEETFYPGVKDVKVTVNGVPNKIFSQGIKNSDFWDEMYRKFGKRDSSITPTEFYTKKFGLFIDLRSMKDNDIVGSGLNLKSSKEGVQLELNRNKTGSGNVNLHIFVLSDAEFWIKDKRFYSVKY